MPNRLYVGNLDFRTTSQDLAELFTGAGRVVNSHVIMDRETGQSKGFAFVEMSSEAEALQAISLYNGHVLHDRPLAVNQAREKSERSERNERNETWTRGNSGRTVKPEPPPQFRQVRHKSRGGANKRRF